jgi:hypothetical protein
MLGAIAERNRGSLLKIPAPDFAALYPGYVQDIPERINKDHVRNMR